jgi:hypothetical protein
MCKMKNVITRLQVVKLNVDLDPFVVHVVEQLLKK